MRSIARAISTPPFFNEADRSNLAAASSAAPQIHHKSQYVRVLWLVLRRTRSAATAMLSSIIFLIPVTLHAQDLAVDAANQNKGDLAQGSLKFGGVEPEDPFLCRITQFGPPQPCLPVPTMEGIASTRVPLPSLIGHPPRPNNQFGLDFYTGNQSRLSITHAGRIGIGTITPAFNVQVRNAGDVQIALESTDKGHRLWTIQSSGAVDPTKVGTFQIIDRDQNVQRLGIDSQGMVTVKALQITGGADLAEPFNTDSQLPPGSLVAIDDAHPGRLIASTRAYDRRIAGVVSGANNIRPGVTLEQFDPKQAKQQVALTGRVYALADTSNGPIHAGDLLTSSGVPTHAMRATDLRRAQGAIIGKAMSPLRFGTGFVLVLVSLQ